MAVNPVLDQMSTHLEFLGYEVTRDEEKVRARHARNADLVLRPFEGGILFTSIFGCKDEARKNRVGYLSLINSLNQKAAVVRFYADEESDLFIEAWHPNSYDRVSFGHFMDLVNGDIDHLFTAPDVGRFLQ